MSTETTHPDPDQKKIIHMYTALAICIIFSIIPHVAAAALSIVFLLYVLMLAYAARRKSAPDSLLANHMTFIIRTIWLTGVYAAFTLAAGCFYLLKYIDNGPLTPCIDKFLKAAPATATMASVDDVGRIFEQCMDPFVHTNFQVLFISLMIAGAPILLYLIIRFARGFSRALHGYRIAHPDAWF